jgi:hypothetical protein
LSRNNPAIAFSSVDFPAPFGPMIATSYTSARNARL